MRCAVNLSLEGAYSERIEDYQHWWDPHNVVGKIGAIVIIIIICSGIIGNILVLFAVCMTRKLRKSYNAFIAALAVTDLVFNLTIMPFYADSYIHRSWRFSDLLCRFHTFFGTMVVISSSLHIAFISINRYVLIVHQDKYNKCFSKPAILVQILIIWLVSFIIVLPGILGWHAVVRYSDQIGRCNYVRSDSKHCLYLIFGIGFILPCFIMIFSYLQISYVVYRSKVKLNKYKKKKREQEQEVDLLSSFRPRSRTMPEGREVKRLKAASRNAAMIHLLTTSGLLLPSPHGSTENISISQQNSPDDSSAGSNGDIYRLNTNCATHMLKKIEETKEESTTTECAQENHNHTHNGANNGKAVLNGGMPQTYIGMAKAERGSKNTLEPPTITVTDSDAGSMCSSQSDSVHTPDQRRMSQSLTCLENQQKILREKAGSGLLMPKVKRHTVPMDRLRRQANSLAKGNLSGSFLNRLHQRHHHKQHLRSFRMIIAVFLGFAMTYLPFTILNLVDNDACMNRAWYMVTSLFFWSGACINPWIYGIMNAQFRNAYEDIVCACKRKRNPFQ